MRKYFAVILMFLFGLSLDAQTPMNLDSLLSLLPKTAQDSNKVDLFINIGQQYETSQPHLAREYYLKAGNLSQELNYQLGFCKYAANYTALLNMQGKYDSSLAINFEALKIAEQWGNKMWITKMYFNIGNCYNYKLQHETALSYYLKVVPYFEEINNKPYLALIYDVMQMLYQNLKQYPKAVIYGEKSLALFADEPESNERGIALLNLSVGYFYSTPSQPEKAMKGFQAVLQIAQKNQNQYLEGSALLNIADFYYRKDDMGKARPFYEQALELNRKIGDDEGICIAIRGLSYCKLYENKYDESEKLIQEVLELANKNNFLKEKGEAYSSLAELALSKHNFLEYRYFFRMKDSIEEIILNDELVRATQDKETKYEAEKKQAEIQDLSQQKILQKVYIIGLFLLVILLIILGIISSRNASRKSLLAEKDAKIKVQRINELEKEKQLTATQSLLAGEEAERKRLARDLHDGLGGMLSIIKLKLLNMKGNVILPETEVSVFHHALEMLDGSIRELRRVAHNLMPESLMRYGLKAALTDFCGNIDQVNLHFYGEERRLEEKYEIALFRIIQELVNNAIKHSAAEQINVQVIVESDRMNLVVQDNGKGFDPLKIDQTKTTGLISIRSRVESLNGQMDLISSPGQGTEVQINFKL